MSESQQPYSVFVVDDDENFLDQVAGTLLQKVDGRPCNFFSIKSDDRHKAVGADLVVAFARTNGRNSLDLFAELARRHPTRPIIIKNSPNGAYRAARALAARETAVFTPENGPDSPRADVAPADFPVGVSRPWRIVEADIRRVAALPSTVLVYGETGAGKELVSRCLHRLSPRSRGPLVAVSCLDLSHNLLDSELFGHERGAFTGAINRRQGLFERAHGGTLFLDEIAEAPLELQGKLLRVLEGSSFTRVGGSEPLRPDFRLIAASNRDLAAEVEKGRFRQDLYYRLAVFPIKLPPLRHRRDDILPLALHFVEKASARIGRPSLPISGPALAMLHDYDWPGNVRELENALERALIVAEGPEILPCDVRHEIPEQLGCSGGLSLEAVEAAAIRLALDRCGRNKSRTARMLGIARKTLADKMVRHGIDIHA